MDLHNELKILALGPDQGGITPTLHLSSRVANVDAEAGMVTLINGDVHEADLIVAADGIHVSVIRTFSSHITDQG